MSKYGIFRVEKIKSSSGGELFNRLKHSFRQFSYQNEKTPDNFYFGENAENSFSEYKKLTEKCVKKSDSVGSFEVVLTSTERPEWKKKDYDAYLKSAMDWAFQKFGKENCFGAVVHRDEKVPHVHMFFSPVETVERKKKQTAEEKKNGTQRTEKITQLNAKKWFNGFKALSLLQTDFYEKVTKKYDFERGELAENTKRTHQRIRLDKEIERYKKLSEELEKQIKQSKGVEFRLKLFRNTLELIPAMKKDCKIADIFTGLNPDQARKIWEKVRILADEFKAENMKKAVETVENKAKNQR